jgi:hypothetical protein
VSRARHGWPAERAERASGLGSPRSVTYIPNISAEDEVRKITTNLFEKLNIIYTKDFAHRDLKSQVYSNNSYQSSFASIIIVEY